jgi:EAL domain-containing protein (putative c-di-GMP-specific phosphodiesterase class I)
VARALEETGLDPRCLELEITESLLVQDIETSSRTLDELKRVAGGVRISIDDFGTGYSSLSYLKSFPIDLLKIDRSFVRNLATDPDDAAITAAIIGLAHNLRLKVIAEGVETEEQLAFLKNKGCDEAQGYYFGRPLPAEDITRLLGEGRSLL